MTFPKFVKFEETQEVLFSSVEVGQEFKFNGRAWIRKDFKEAPIQLGAEVNSHRLLRFYDDNIVTTHRPLETKPLGECKPGDVVEMDGYTQSRVVMQGSGLFNLVTLRAEAWVPGNDRVVTIIGKAVCDEG